MLHKHAVIGEYLERMDNGLLLAQNSKVMQLEHTQENRADLLLSVFLEITVFF